MKSPLFFLCFAALLFCSCSEQAVIKSDDSSEVSPAQSELRILTWSEYIAPSIIEKFKDEYGIAITEVYYDNQEEIYALLEAENYKYDLSIASRATVKRLQDRDLIQQYDLDRITEAAFSPKFRNLDIDPDNLYTIPYFWGSTLIAYRSDLVPNAPDTSFSALFDPQLSGRTALLSDHLERFAVANKVNGKGINDRSDDALNGAFDLLNKYFNEMGGEVLSDQEVREQLISGELWLSHCYNGDAAMIAKEEPAIKYFMPSEGAGLWVDLIVMTREARNSDAAYKFINFLNRPDICAENANYVCYATPNEAAFPLLDEELINDPAIFPSEEILKNCEFFEDATPEILGKMSELSRSIFEFSEVTEGASDTPQ